MFKNVFYASLTIFQIMLMGYKWGETVLLFSKANPFLFPTFFFVHSIIQLALLNLIIAAICDRAAEAQKAEEVARQFVKIH